MYKKVILDRSYAFNLVGYIHEMYGKKDSLGIFDKQKNPQMKNTLDVINEAAIMFDKILIEDYYGSSLYKVLNRNEFDWFWELFEIYSPDSIGGSNVEKLIIEDSIRLDLEDKELKSIISKLSSEYAQPNRYESLLWNIIRTLFSAKQLDAAILPWQNKINIYRYKFSKNVYYPEESSISKTMHTILEFQVPLFDIDSLQELIKIRKDKRLFSFRKLVWNIAQKLEKDNSDTNDNFVILQELEKLKANLIGTLKPTMWSRVFSLATSPIPFPFNVLVDSVYQVLELKKLSPFKWYFFLRDLSTKDNSR